MKKFTALLFVFLMTQSMVPAKNYLEIQAKETQKAQNYNSSQKFFNDTEVVKKILPEKTEVKDPKLFTFGKYKEISQQAYNKKLQEDETQYLKVKAELESQKSDNFNKQAYARDYYTIYKIADKIIRANKLDYIDWRIGITSDESFNAANAYMNYVKINAGALDSLARNEDALALLIAHELGHGLLGHSIRTQNIYKWLNWFKSQEPTIGGIIRYNQNLNELRMMELAADTEAAKLITKAGYNLDKAKELLSFINTFDSDVKYGNDTHPTAEVRISSYNKNIKYFMEEEWRKEGRYNIYNSKVLSIQPSSDRHTIVIYTNNKKNKNDAYKPETLEELYTRYAYKSYLLGEYKTSKKYFKKMLSANYNKPAAYLYLSYIEENIYNSTGNEKFLKKSKFFAQKALELEPNNKFIKQQIDSL